MSYLAVDFNDRVICAILKWVKEGYVVGFYYGFVILKGDWSWIGFNNIEGNLRFFFIYFFSNMVIIERDEVVVRLFFFWWFNVMCVEMWDKYINKYIDYFNIFLDLELFIIIYLLSMNECVFSSECYLG